MYRDVGPSFECEQRLPGHQPLKLYSETFNAAQSPLLRLPGELRNNIIIMSCPATRSIARASRIVSSSHCRKSAVRSTARQMRLSLLPATSKYDTVLRHYLECIGESRARLTKTIILDLGSQYRVCHDANRDIFFAGASQRLSLASGLEKIVLRCSQFDVDTHVLQCSDHGACIRDFVDWWRAKLNPHTSRAQVEVELRVDFHREE